MEERRRQDAYDMAVKIRAFERTALELFAQDKLSGTTHTYIGQEATAAAAMSFVGERDVVFSNHRCHGHYLAYGGDERALLAEIMSKESGLCGGRGGSQHIHYKNFYTNGIQGGILPNALGVAFAKKLDQKKDRTVVFLGDGTLGQGVVYETLNIASVFQIPMLFIVEDNQYAMSTRREDAISGDIAERIRGFAVETLEIASTDTDELLDFFEKAFRKLDTGNQPVCAVVHNYRLGAHSKGDDTRDAAEIERHMQWDPIAVLERKLGRDEVGRRLRRHSEAFAQMALDLEGQGTARILSCEAEALSVKETFFCEGGKRCNEQIREALGAGMERNKNIIVYGEDVKDPYGGAFKATKGLSGKYPGNLFNMPISEACMVGMAVGMALAGKIPVVEIMFGDFLALAMDQLLNHAVKYGWIYGEAVQVPMVIRTPMGGGRGYGPTHSQSLEKFLMGIPLLKVLALSPLHNPKLLYQTIFDTISSPTVVIENKKLYAERMLSVSDHKCGSFFVEEINHYGYSTMRLSLDRQTAPDITVVTYGGMVRDAMKAAEELLLEDEIQADLVVVSQLLPLPKQDIREAINGKAPMAVVEEGTVTAGIGAEIVAWCAQERLAEGYLRIGAHDLPIPNGIKLERQALPDWKCIIERIREFVK